MANKHTCSSVADALAQKKDSELRERVYQQGRQARIDDQERNANPFEGMMLKHYWLAGWHDVDMEMTGPQCITA